MRVLAIVTGLLLACLSTATFAENNYIKDIQKVTFRSGPGTDNKIIKMLEAETKLKVLEAGAEWTKVRDEEGNEGYVLNRFLTKDIPHVYLYKWLKNKHEKLNTRFEELKKKQAELSSTLKEREKALTDSNQQLTDTQKSFTELKEGAGKYLQLQSEYKRTKALLEDQNARVLSLESQLSKHYIYWFLAGAGVLFLGWIIGVTSKKKRHSPGLSF